MFWPVSIFIRVSEPSTPRPTPRGPTPTQAPPLLQRVLGRQLTTMLGVGEAQMLEDAAAASRAAVGTPPPPGVATAPPHHATLPPPADAVP